MYYSHNTKIVLSEVRQVRLFKAVAQQAGEVVALSAHTPRVQPSAYNVSTRWRSKTRIGHA